MTYNLAHSRMIRQSIRSKYAWPGGYPMYLVMMDGESLCMDCAKTEYRQIARANRYGDRYDGWATVGADVNWEDPELYCAHCGKRIESAYAEDDAK